MKYSILFSALILVSCSRTNNWKIIEAQGNCSARHECGFVAHNNAIYLIGGRGLKPVDKFEIGSEAWEALNNTPIEMHHITPVSINGAIYIVTGLTGNYPKEKPLNSVYRYRPENKTWTSVLKIPESRQRGGAGITVFNSKIYIVNGITNGHTSGTNAMFDVYDPVKNTWEILPDAPTKRDHSAAAILDNKLIALGGRNTSYHEPNNFQAFFKTVINTVDCFDFKTKEWQILDTKLPNPSAGGGIVVLNDKLFFLGGETEQKEASKEMYSFELGTNTWTKEASLNQGRHGTNAVVLDTSIYIASGSGNQGGGPELTSIEIYN